MAMREHGEIAPGEGRLRARQRLETDGGIGNNRGAIGAGDRAMVGSALGFFALCLAACRGGADLVLRFERDALLGIAAMIDTRFDPEFCARNTDILCPGRAPKRAPTGERR